MGQSHYFDPEPGVASRRSTVRLSIGDLEVELLVDRGVFSANAVDPGTVALLKSNGREGDYLASEGDLLDLGCGYGPIACTLARRHPDRVVWAVDVNTRALELTGANAAALQLPNVQTRLPDEMPRGLVLAGIWSNPPIRIGKVALHDLLIRWLELLSERGEARLVVHRHLGGDSLAEWLDGQGWTVSRLASKRGYRILAVRST